MNKIFLPLLAFLFLFVQNASAESCELRTCQRGYADGCVTSEEAKELDMFCYNHPCGACAEFGYESECYNKFATCEKQASGCGWKKSPEFEKCVTEAKEKFIKENSVDSSIEKMIEDVFGKKPVPLEDWNKQFEKK